MADPGQPGAPKGWHILANERLHAYVAGICQKWLPSSSGVTAYGPMPTANVYNGKNQNPNISYDSAGNQTGLGGLALSYDAENRQTQATNVVGGGTASYQYDGLGQRVLKTVGSQQAVYVFDAFGKLAAEYDSTQPAVALCGTCYLTYDHLGSVRMVTDQNGNVVGRHDYAPFGVEIAAGTDGRTGSAWGATTDVTPRFTGQLRDTETGEDYFNARYLYAGLGRFLSADPGNAGADVTNPQSWNGYAYVLGNPLKLTDRSGKAANYSGIPDGVCPASQASCNVAWTSLAPSSFWQDIPSITPNDMNYGLAAYLNNVRYGGYGGGPAAAWGWVAGDDPRVIMGYAALSSPDEVTGAAATAQLALSSPSCAALFSGLGNGTTGWSLLSQGAVSYGGLLPERLGQTFGSNDLANPTPGSNSIVINNYSSQGGLLPASPFSGMSGQRAAQAGAQTIIHELLHVAIMMYGPSAVTPPSGAFALAWMQKDSGPGIPDSAEALNNSIISLACGIRP